jgi:SAM-dependent methyltransferase
MSTVDTSTTTDAHRRLVERWERQQAAYVAHRENRFEVMLDVLALHGPPSPTVLDLACGPGSISDRVLRRFPDATAVAVDYDPVLARVAERTLADHDGRATVLDVDLATPGWSAALGTQRFDAVLSSTALHWLSPGQLLAVYTELAALLAPGAVLLNADHLRFDDRSPTLRAISAAHDRRCQDEAFSPDTPDWATWWTEAAQVPGLVELVPLREQRFADRPPQPHSPLELHLAALRTAGFAEVGTVWQYLDDYVVFARR